MRRVLGLLFFRSLGLCLALGCSQAINTPEVDMSPDTPDLSTSGGVDDMASSGAPGLALIAGQLGGPGDGEGTGAAARFTSAISLGMDGAGNLYVADPVRNVRKIALASGAVSTPSRDCANMVAVAADGVGNIYYSNSFSRSVFKVAAGSTLSMPFVGGGAANADGTGRNAGFTSPLGMAWDGADTLYVADEVGTIRRVVLSTAAVTTLAGTAGMSGNVDGTGPAARFTRPAALAWDGSGNLYVADKLEHTIRKIVVMSGAVTTLAGSPGAAGSTDGAGPAARFRGPLGIAADRAGNVYVADSGNYTIRKIVAATGAVTTLAGTAGMSGISDGTGAAARFATAADVHSDGAGSLYVADGLTVRRIVAATGVVTTLAGLATHSGETGGTGPAALFNMPRGVASDGAGALYVADSLNHSIRKIAMATGAVTLLAGTSRLPGDVDGPGITASFRSPYGVAADKSGNVYVADTVNHTIRKIVAATGRVTTLAGMAFQSGNVDGTGSAARFFLPHDVTADGAGSVYVADTNNCRIRKIDAATAAVTTLAGGSCGIGDGIGTAARFYTPYGLIADGGGNLYVADTVNYTIRKIVIATGEVTTLAGTAMQRGTADGTGAAARFYSPKGLALDGRGNLYVADRAPVQEPGATIRKIVLATGQVTTMVGSPGPGTTGVIPGPLPGRLNVPWGLAWVANQGLVITDNAENSVLIARGL